MNVLKQRLLEAEEAANKEEQAKKRSAAKAGTEKQRSRFHRAAVWLGYLLLGLAVSFLCRRQVSATACVFSDSISEGCMRVCVSRTEFNRSEAHMGVLRDQLQECLIDLGDCFDVSDSAEKDNSRSAGRLELCESDIILYQSMVDGCQQGNDELKNKVQAINAKNVRLKAQVGADRDATCFHVDTVIDYKGVSYTREELASGREAECTVPHTPLSQGVVITTSCYKTVRVTNTHLMATTTGFQMAYSLKAGDVLFGDYNDYQHCVVQSVEKEETVQQYFGLNCVHSEVLASGLRASTFGDFHTLPSWYMTYVGGLVGSSTASSIGDIIAEWYHSS